MGAPEDEHIFGIQLRESANDGSDFSNADADYRKVFLGEDGFLHAKDSAGAVTDPYDTSSGFTNGAFDIERRTAGDLSVTSTTLGAAIPTLGNNIVAAASGDLLLIGVSTQADNGSGGRLRMDIGTIVSAAVVNYVSSLSGTAATAGISGWGAEATTFTRIGPSIVYVVQSGDVSGGNVELSLRAWNASAGTRVVSASSTTPLVFWVKNLKQ